jgi:hypothetical protein
MKKPDFSNLLLCLVNSWNSGYCYTADDGAAVESAIIALCQKHFEGRVDFDSALDLYQYEEKLKALFPGPLEN